MIRKLLAMGSLAGLLLHPTLAIGWSIDQLMETLANNPGGRVEFHETRYLEVLDEPIEARGYMVYQRPDRLERHTQQPRPETMILDGNQVTLEDDSGTTQLDLRLYTQLAGVVGSIRSTLAGDKRALEFYYRIGLRGTAERWVLELIPDDEQVERYIEAISIGGSEHQINTIEIRHADGDRSITHLFGKAR